ncbi:hypothetical protein MIT9_P2567 [Methylomarinovum caldicuralii]|uniref:Cytoplasmic protein n=1 Tax=Methylomarinovum caldicuralii TaxID=438856 RepID=A0AAU9BVZ5_9GAMM|nr:hypothetical protein [Methylomarinovum caldicuralii]BCX82976.1 hypothetical protein MIT9_P2567 [Methylomarinovum caldicuralii]
MTDESQAHMDPDNLYREETYTDLKTGTIKRLIPVTAEGMADPNRKEMFLGQATIMTPVGSLPLSFEIEADTLKDAVEKYGEAAEKGIRETMEELRRLQQEQASSLVIPKGGAPGGDMPGGSFPGAGGGMPGGGIKLP